MRQVVTLDMGLLVAGTKYRGEFEERLKKLMEEIKQNSDIILVRARRPGRKPNLTQFYTTPASSCCAPDAGGWFWQALQLQHAQAGTLLCDWRPGVKGSLQFDS